MSVLRDSGIRWFLGAILLTCFLITLFRFFRCQLRIIWLALRLPGAYTLVLSGEDILEQAPKYLGAIAKTCRKDFGSLFRIWVTVYPVVVVLKPDYIQKILSSSKHVNKIFFFQFFRNILGNGLILMSGEKWHTHRKLLQPFFHIKTLENLFEVSKKGSEVLLARIQNQINCRSSQFDIKLLVRQTVQGMATEIIFGTPMDLSPMEGKRLPFQKSLVNLLLCPTQPWYLPNVVYKLTQRNKKEMETKNALRRHFTKMVEARQNYTHENKCLLDHLLEINKSYPDFTKEDCFEECQTFMIAGQDSVESTLAIFLHEIAKHPEFQEKIVEELNTVLGSSENTLRFTDLGKLKYLEQCIKESMRLYPTAPIIGRTLGEDVQLGDYTLPKGCGVLFSTYLTHRLDEHFENPEVFDPDRFNPANAEHIPPYAFLPFSAGPRICIGYKLAMQEVKVMAATVLRNYRLSPVPNKEHLDLQYHIVLVISGGIWINFTPRHEIPVNEAKGKFNIRNTGTSGI